MGNQFLDIIKARRPRIDYVSPAICEAQFSGSSNLPAVFDNLPPLPSPPRITGSVLTWFGSAGTSNKITWEVFPGAICYTIYKLQDSTDPNSDFVLVAECVTDPEFNPPLQDPGHDPETPECYLVQAITPDGVSAIGAPICEDCKACEKPGCCDGEPDGKPNQPGNLPPDGTGPTPPGGGGGGGVGPTVNGGTCPLILTQPLTTVNRVEGQITTLGTVTVDPGLLQDGSTATLRWEWWKDGELFRDTTATTQGQLSLGAMQEIFAGVYVLKIFTNSPRCATISANAVTLNFTEPFDEFDWNNLVWADPPTTEDGGAAGEYTGDHWSVNIPSGDQDNPATVDNQGEMVVNIDAIINCRLTVTITAYTGDAGTTNCPIRITQDGIEVLNINLRNDTPAAPGVYTFDFSLNPASASLIKMENAAGQAFFADNNIIYTATLTVLP